MAPQRMGAGRSGKTLQIVGEILPSADDHTAAREDLLQHPRRDEGTLANRILQRLRRQGGSRSGPASAPTRDQLAAVYRELADCLREGRMLRAER